jgi:Gpi18-like mannosyltransferase
MISTLFNLAKKHYLYLISILMVSALKISLFPNQSFDISYFLSPWFDFLKLNGIFSLSYPFNNYNPPYTLLLYLATFFTDNSVYGVKAVSFLFDFVFAYYSMKIVDFYRPNIKQISFLTAFASPILIINSSIWGQCDVIYTTFLLICIYHFLNDRIYWAMFNFAIAFTFKFQTFFFLPVLAFLFFSKYIRFNNLYRIILIFVATFLVPLVIPVLFGRPVYSTRIYEFYNPEGVLNIYLNQLNTQNQLVLYSVPTLYNWIPNVFYKIFYPNVFLFSLSIVGIAVWVLTKLELSQEKIKKELLRISFLLTTLFIYLLPKMQERYFFLPTSLAVLFTLVYPKKWWIAAMIYIPCMYGDFRGSITYTGQVPFLGYSYWGALTVIIAVIFLAIELIKDNKKII